MPSTLEVKDLHAGIEDKEILKGVNLKVTQGEIHAVMGPNGSGKSTLANVIMGHPRYHVISGDVLLDGESVLGMTADQRAKKGFFLAFQYPLEIPGVPLANFLRMAYNAVKGTRIELKTKGSELMAMMQFRKRLKEKLALVEMDDAFADRYLNEGFSGGEKKRCEILQMAVIEPKISVLDETDSGLDIDAVKVVSNGVNKLAGDGMGVLVITHYQRILRYIKPQYVHVMVDGKIVSSGGPELAETLEEKGYDWVKEKAV